MINVYVPNIVQSLMSVYRNCTDHLQLTLNRAKVEIEKATAEILGQQKYIATEVTLSRSIFSHFHSLLYVIQMYQDVCTNVGNIQHEVKILSSECLCRAN